MYEQIVKYSEKRTKVKTTTFVVSADFDSHGTWGTFGKKFSVKSMDIGSCFCLEYLLLVKNCKKMLLSKLAHFSHLLTTQYGFRIKFTFTLLPMGDPWARGQKF